VNTKPAPRPLVKLPGPSCLEHRVEIPCSKCDRDERIVTWIMGVFIAFFVLFLLYVFLFPLYAMISTEKH
jgi:hypothetical protein